MARGPCVCSLNKYLGVAFTSLSHREQGLLGVSEEAGAPSVLTPGLSRLGHRQTSVVRFWLHPPPPIRNPTFWEKMSIKHITF